MPPPSRGRHQAARIRPAPRRQMSTARTRGRAAPQKPRPIVRARAHAPRNVRAHFAAVPHRGFVGPARRSPPAGHAAGRPERRPGAPRARAPGDGRAACAPPPGPHRQSRRPAPRRPCARPARPSAPRDPLPWGAGRAVWLWALAGARPRCAGWRATVLPPSCAGTCAARSAPGRRELRPFGTPLSAGGDLPHDGASPNPPAAASGQGTQAHTPHRQGSG